MRRLLDTQVLLWALGSRSRLGKTAPSAIEDASNEVMFSAASIWEIAIKWALKRLDFTITPDETLAAAIETGFEELPVR
jgi:PIN domain nuclease of toxin-antitoxin system